MCKNHNFCISAKTGVIQNNIGTKRRNKDSKADIGPKAGEDTFINKKDRHCYFGNNFLLQFLNYLYLYVQFEKRGDYTTLLISK